MIKDKIIFNEDFEDIRVRCQVCYSKNHTSRNCPVLHFIPDKEYIVKKHVYPQSNVKLLMFLIIIIIIFLLQYFFKIFR